MKKLVLTISLILSTAFVIFAQNSPCPSITVTGPSGVTRFGDSMTFTVSVDGNSDKITYKWSVDKGTIVSGHGTPVITVATNADMNGQTVTATVEIDGLPQNCPKVASGAGEVYSGGHPIAFDDYGKLLWRDERKRLDAVALELNNHNNTKVFFIIRTSSKDNSQTFQIHSEKIKKYLMEKYKFSEDRFEFVFAGEDDFNVRVYLAPIDPK